MPYLYKKPTDPKPQEQWYDQGQLTKLNSTALPRFLTELGINMTRPGNPVPETKGAPRVFLMDEKGTRSLADEGVRTGTPEFWELMRQGRMFAYPAGQTEPVQLQIEGEYPPEMHVTAPLSKSAQDFKYEAEPPEPMSMPDEVRRPGWFSRLMNSINSNWYKAENDAYKNYRLQCEQIRVENEKQKQAYEAKAAEAKQKVEDACKAASDQAKKAFGASRASARDLEIELVDAERYTEDYKEAVEQDRREHDAEVAKKAEDRTLDSIENMISMYGPKPYALPRLTEAKCYDQDAIKSLTPLEIPNGMKIGETLVDDRLFANLALHAQMDPSISRPFLDTRIPTGDTCKQAEREGMSKAEIDRMAGLVCAGMCVTGAVQTTPRADYKQFFPLTDEGRKLAHSALTEYQKGNREPLAQIITNAATLTVCIAKEGGAGAGALTGARLTNDLLDLLKQDEALAKAAKDKGLTGKNIKTCRNMELVRELAENALLADSKIAEAAANPEIRLSDAEKKAYMMDVVKFRTVEALMAKETASEKQPEFQKAEKALDERVAATQMQMAGKAMPKGMKPLDGSLRIYMSEHNRMEYVDTPPILQKLRVYRDQELALAQIGEKPEPTALDRLVENTVVGLGYDKMDVQELGKHVGSTALKNNDLILAQNKIAKGELKPKAVEEKVNELDIAVDYGHGEEEPEIGLK